MGGDNRDDVDGRVRELPGPELATWLCSFDIGGVSAHDLVAIAAAWERVKAFADARLVQVLAQLTGRPEYQRCTCPSGPDVVHTHRAVEPAGDEVSLAMSWSPGRARTQVAVASELCDDLPATLAALEDGRVDYDKARLITERTRCLSTVALRRHVEDRVLPRSARQTRTQLDHALRREVIAADPAAAEQRRRAARDRRHVSRPEPSAPGGDDGMATLEVHGPAEDLAALFTAIDAAARHARHQGDERTLDQLRFDTLTGLAWTALDTGHLCCCNPTCTDSHDHQLATMHRTAATVHVTVPVTTLTGTHEQPGHLDGFGPITANAARHISTEGPWRQLICDPTGGQLLDYGRTTYTPPADLTAYIITRDRTCRFPTCHHPARNSDIDHKRPFAQGGTTSTNNTWALHRGHHLSKTHHNFTPTTDPDDGTTTWTTPAGHTYPTEPETIGPLTRT